MCQYQQFLYRMFSVDCIEYRDYKKILLQLKFAAPVNACIAAIKIFLQLKPAALVNACIVTIKTCYICQCMYCCN